MKQTKSPALVGLASQQKDLVQPWPGLILLLRDLGGWCRAAAGMQRVRLARLSGGQPRDKEALTKGAENSTREPENIGILKTK